MKSIYDKIEKVRKPRVHISYELEDGDSTVKQELPFVIGVMGDYSGDSQVSKMPFKARKFIQIDGDNFNQVMAKMQPQLSFKVDNTLTEEAGQLAVDLTFNQIDDFEPENVAKQVPALKKLLEVRAQLHDLLSKADRSEELEGLLEKILQDNAQLAQLKQELDSQKKEADSTAEPDSDKEQDA